MINRSFDNDLIPDYFYNRLVDITPTDLQKMGAKAVALDIDNTVAVDALYRIFDGVPDWIRQTTAAGFPVMILSNTWAWRAKYISGKLGHIPYIPYADKPDAKNFFKAAEMLGVDISELAMIGDQLFTDIRGANNVGAISMLVRPRHREILLFFHYLRTRRTEKKYLKQIGSEKNK